METNPFEVILSPEFENLQEESLDFLMLGIERTNKMANQFNPWYHRIPNWIVAKLSITRSGYDWLQHDPDVYSGPERRSHVRMFWTSCKRNVTIALMPRTKKIQQIRDVA